MKLFVVCLLVSVTLSMAAPQEYPRGCFYINGRCDRECEVGTHAYTTGCNRKMPEATCEAPNPVLEQYDICDFSACYCDAPTLRDKSGKCVMPKDCSKN